MKEHPNIQINETILQQTDFHTKMMALAAADELPDVFFVKGSWIQNFYDNGLMADMTSSINKSKYRDGIFVPFTRNGKIFATPIQFIMTSMVYYNKKMFADIGYDHFPKTWAELVDADKKFKAKGIDTITLGNKDKWPYESCVISTLGDRITGTDWTQSIIANDGKAKFTDPQFVKVLDYSQQMAKMFNKNFNAITNEQSTAQYGQGKAACTIEGSWSVAYQLATSNKDVLDNTGVAVLPSFPEEVGDPNSTSGGAGWGQAVSAKLTGAKLQAAIDYCLATNGPELSQFFMDDTGLLGPSPVEVKNKASLPKLSQDYLDLAASVKLVPIYDIQMEGSVIDVMNSKLQDLLAGDDTPQNVAKAIQDAQDKL